MKHARALVCLLALSLPGLTAAAGWTQAKGHHYGKISWRGLFGVGPLAQAYGEEGDSIALPKDFNDQALNLYGEWGLTDAVTLVGFGTPIGWSSYGQRSTVYVGATGVGLRYGVPLGRAHLAVEGRYAYASSVGEKRLGSGVAEGEPFTYVPTVRTHRVEGELQVGYPLSFGWLSATAGYQHFTRSGLDPAVQTAGQVGWLLSSRWQVEAHINLHEILGTIQSVNVTGAGQTRYLGAGGSGTWWWSPSWGLHLGLEGVIYAMSNAETPTWLMGVETR